MSASSWWPFWICRPASISRSSILSTDRCIRAAKSTPYIMTVFRLFPFNKRFIPQTTAAKKIPFRQHASLDRSTSPYGALNCWGLKPIKLDGWLVHFIAYAFNRLGQYVSSPSNVAYCYAELAVSSLAVAVTTASIYCSYPKRDGQADMAWVVVTRESVLTCQWSSTSVLPG